jgi:hypothetical protein
MNENWLLGRHARVQRNSAMSERIWTPLTDKAINTCRDMYCIEDLHGMYTSEHREFLCVE